ncbi:MAG TPA: dihydrolipoyl dehydrogenase [Geminicoccaceae bacterium]|jgi:dihydrolipoamide dehydrogenase|nr:dihydrolipoyl dehydrogenase [Geminicoccaceae bacterium]
MTDDSFDVVVIGAGPGGYVCAIRAAQLGMKVACIDKRGTFGGTCLNIGCIPSKALLHSSELFAEARDGLNAYGIKIPTVELDLGAMQDQKAKVVKELTQGVEFLFRKNRVTGIKGSARLNGPGRVQVELNGGGSQELSARHVVLATGSESALLPGIEIDEQRIVSSTGALELDAVPGHLLVVGAGYIGLELGTVWRRLGAKVTVIEYLDRITPGMDLELSRQFQRLLSRQGLGFKLATKVSEIDGSGDRLLVTTEAVEGGEPERMKADVALVAVGRRPYTEGLGLETVNLATDNHGRLEVGDNFSTNAPGIYAIGDLIRGPMLAHKAEDEGVCVAEHLAGQRPHIDYDAIPAVIYTAPEVASVGRSEEQLKEAGIAYKTGKFPFSANARARATGQTDGFVKVLADAATDRLLGVHIIGAEAGTMIGEAALAMEFGASSEDLARTSHAHPTLEEAIKEAALAAYSSPLHI